VNRAEALALLRSGDELTFDALEDVFLAFGFTSESPDFETELYFHPKWRKCGAFTARDDGVHLVTPLQRRLVLAILRCVEFNEAFSHGR
jgi:hypothetical protein